MVTIKFRGGDLKEVVNKALSKHKEVIKERFGVVTDRMAHDIIIAYRTDSELKDFQEYTGNALVERFVASQNMFLTSGYPLEVLRDKIEAGEEEVLEHPLEGVSRRIVGRADIVCQDNYITYANSRKGVPAMALIRTGWPLEYLGMWHEDPVPPHYYISTMRKDALAIVFNIRKYYRQAARRAYRRR